MNNKLSKPKKTYTKKPLRAHVKKNSKLIMSKALSKVGATNPRIKSNVKRGDEVVVISGDQKGKVSKVLEVYQNGKILVEGVNVKTKHKKAQGPGAEGEIIKIETPIYSCKVMLWDESSKKATRVGKKILEDGRKVRIAKTSNEELG